MTFLVRAFDAEIVPVEPLPSPVAVSPVATGSIRGPIFAATSAEPLERFAYVPSRSWPLLAPPPAGDLPPPPAGEPVEPAVAGPWSVETQRVPSDSPVKSVAALPRLPWLAPAPPPRQYSLSEKLAEISPGATRRLADRFEAVKAVWPPAEVALVAIKDERTLELHARPAGGAWTFIHRYKIFAASGGAGPKLFQGDRQVPEGVYGISFLNPNSRYHVSLRVNYPNAFDRQMAVAEGRKDLGGDIMIHGKAASVGCLAMGDEAAEELFVLAAQTGLPRVKLVIAPTDFRRHPPAGPAEPGQPAWLPRLYTEVASAMTDFKAPPRSTGLLSLFSD